jgi:hypothetical protein
MNFCGAGRDAWAYIQFFFRKGKPMKTCSLVLLLMASLAFVLGGCSENSNSVVPPSENAIAAASSPAGLAKGACVQMVTGSGQQVSDGTHWTLAFTAQKDADGNCTGMIEAHDRYFALKFHLTVQHLDVLGNQAYLVAHGTLPELPAGWYGPDPIPPGPGYALILLTDNGQGKKAELPDQQSYFVPWPDSPAFEFLTENLATASVNGFKEFALTNMGFQEDWFILETNMGNTVIHSR